MEMEEGRGGGRGLGLSEEGDKMEAGLDVAGDWLWVWTQGTHWLWSRPGSRAGSGKHRMTWYCVRTWWVLGLTDFKNEAADPHASRSSESTGSLLEMPIVSLCPRSTELDFSLWGGASMLGETSKEDQRLPSLSSTRGHGSEVLPRKRGHS
ncbi:uncharacterized protein LOC114671702 isoform X2 [Macaca mulatta]